MHADGIGSHVTLPTCGQSRGRSGVFPVDYNSPAKRFGEAGRTEARIYCSRSCAASSLFQFFGVGNLPIVDVRSPLHSKPSSMSVPGNKWLDIAMIRVNHKGKSMDAEDYATQGLGNVPEVVEHVKEVRKEGMGVVAMKLIGEGTFNREDRREAMKFAFKNAGVDCVSVGYKSTAEIDEAIENLNMALTYDA
jgi:hypothetical protein